MYVEPTASRCSIPTAPSSTAARSLPPSPRSTSTAIPQAPGSSRPTTWSSTGTASRITGWRAGNGRQRQLPGAMTARAKWIGGSAARWLAVGAMLLAGPGLMIATIRRVGLNLLYDFKGGLYNAGVAILQGHTPYQPGFLAHQAALMRAGACGPRRDGRPLLLHPCVSGAGQRARRAPERRCPSGWLGSSTRCSRLQPWWAASGCWGCATGAAWP